MDRILFSVVLYAMLITLVWTDRVKPKDCEDVKASGHYKSGIYVIYPERTNGILVLCDMDTAGGGWTVIQRRVSNSDFYQNWDTYQIGFGDLDTNFWLGNLQISRLTSQSWYQLRIDMTNENGVYAYAVYDVFAVGDTASKYELLVNGYHGNASDGLQYHNGRKFTTYDVDNDPYGTNCAKQFLGAWWHGACHNSNLNGGYGNKAYGEGIIWDSFTGDYSSLTFVEMKVKRWSPRVKETKCSST